MYKNIFVASLYNRVATVLSVGTAALCSQMRLHLQRSIHCLMYRVIILSGKYHLLVLCCFTVIVTGC